LRRVLWQTPALKHTDGSADSIPIPLDRQFQYHDDLLALNMTEDVSAYRPDFSPGSWSARDLHFLEAFASNPGGLVCVLRNLPPEITGALCSRASRATGSLLEVLLREYIDPIVKGDDPTLARELEDTVTFLREHGFKNILNNQRAQAFYAKWLSQYGDDSIAQITGTHVILWGVSQVAMKFQRVRPGPGARA
jgi:hypothetical protein